jgi:hypothetical protein
MTTATEQRAADLRRQRRDEIPTYFAGFLLDLGRDLDDDLRELLVRRKEVQRQMVEYAEHTWRRVATARRSTAVVETRPSLPTVEQTLAELEKYTRLDRAVILGCFRQGRRSAEQHATREKVDRAIRAMVEHYTMVHPHVGTPQFTQARGKWPGYVGVRGRKGRDDGLLLIMFGKLDDEGEIVPYDCFTIRPSNRQSSSPRRNRKRRPHIAERIAEALDISLRTVQRISPEMSRSRDI